MIGQPGHSTVPRRMDHVRLIPGWEGSSLKVSGHLWGGGALERGLSGCTVSQTEKGLGNWSHLSWNPGFVTYSLWTLGQGSLHSQASVFYSVEWSRYNNASSQHGLISPSMVLGAASWKAGEKHRSQGPPYTCRISNCISTRCP